ncbi:hypothetical protein BTL55_02165 [Bordetella trematum]|uniref:DUF2285 domain-containing protein n=1 Tax=Bordetella trematum TaxID=123899 RepID=UPI000C78FB53|nr:DUF2285 domain-containing protein [Bordetella trematum]AUL45911.1 hypothetical protein BTL55_02165 [Bordetella trematum]
MMCGFDAAWRATAGYLYLLHLDGPGLAWEYLRRNPEYQEAWQHADAHLDRWGLEAWEDPVLDARSACPIWNNTILPVLHVTSGPPGKAADSPAFNLWALPGRKRLRVLDAPDGHLALLAQTESDCIRARVEHQALAAASTVYWLPVPVSATQYRDQACLPLPAASGWTEQRRRRRTRGFRSQILHLRALQSVDAAAVGASHREIAEAIFGRDQVQAEWHADSSLRTQLRHYLRRGKFFMRGGYLDLLTPR